MVRQKCLKNGATQRLANGASPGVPTRNFRIRDSGLDHFYAAEMKEIRAMSAKADFAGGGAFEIKLFRSFKNGPPQVVEEIHDQPRVRRGQGLEAFEHRLDIDQIVHQVRENNVIKGLGRRKFSGVRDLKFELGMALAGQLDHRRTGNQ